MQQYKTNVNLIQAYHFVNSVIEGDYPTKPKVLLNYRVGVKSQVLTSCIRVLYNCYLVEWIIHVFQINLQPILSNFIKIFALILISHTYRVTYIDTPTHNYIPYRLILGSHLPDKEQLTCWRATLDT